MAVDLFGSARPIIVPLGGFLGAGKTTLIIAAARVLHAQGLRAAAILNDQGSDLVDTRLAQHHQIAADQVNGGCFCCRFSDLVDAAGRLLAFDPHVIFAEAVGSCTDLSATTLQPLRRDHGDQFRLAPFSVLVDPARANELLGPSADPDLVFLFENQIAEADLVCLTKSDIAGEPPELPGLPVRSMSAATGDGVAEWLHEILEGTLVSRNAILDIDYARYAQAEAALAWLNCRATIRGQEGRSPAMVVGPILDELQAGLMSVQFQIAHLKLIDECDTGYVQASLCGNREDPKVEGDLTAEPAGRHELLLNIRAVGDPAALRAMVETALRTADIQSLECFRPAPPRPQHRTGRA